MSAKPSLVDQIRQAVRDSGLTVPQLGQAAGVDAARLSRFVRGERDLTLAEAAKVCEVLGVRLAGPPPRRPARATPAPPPAGELEAAKKARRRKE